MTVEITANRNPPIDMKVTKAAPPVDPNVELQGAMQKAVELQKAGNAAEPRQVIEAMIVKYPAAYRLNAFVASTYEGEKNYDKAIEHLKIVVEKEPADIDMKSYLAELYTLKGDKAEAQKVLESIDLVMSLNMLVEFGDAFDYTAADFEGWCREVGFTRFATLPLSPVASAAIAFK